MNTGVRTEPGANGEVVVMAAYCPTCRQETLPNAMGCCSWCGTKILDEDTLKVGRDGVSERVFDPKAYWTRERIIDVIQRYHAEHGHTPTSPKWQSGPSTRERPNTALVIKVFGKWSAALAAAGFDPWAYAKERATQGGRKKLGLAEGERDADVHPAPAREEEAPRPLAQVGEPDIAPLIEALDRHGARFLRILAAHHHELADRYEAMADDLAAA